MKRFDTIEYVHEVKSEFSNRGMERTDTYFERCFNENIIGERVTLLAYYQGNLAGCGHLINTSSYPFFLENRIPEINDLNVFPEYRRRGIAGNLLDEFERIASETHEIIGIGVGLYKDYGSAQRLYCKKQYIPDGNGVFYQNEQVKPGNTVPVDDELVLFFTKQLSKG
ncbi:GCN5 family acetyltransferase [Bacillus sp. SA1-12]|nr:GCN5 family acetyltransferase [Bacillus sp. SA1-12]